jgi:hypothetical protein
MSASQRGIAIVVGIIAIAAITFLVVRAGGGIGQGPEPSATATASDPASASAQPSADASPSIDPSAPTDEEALAIFAEIEEQVIAIRGLEAADIGPPDIITRAELADELERLFEEEYPPEEQERDNFALRAHGLLEPGQDVAELQLQLLGDQVLGFYDDVEKRMVVVTDAGLDIEARVTYAHEYTHALQDATYGIDSLETDADGQDDRNLARTALLEGDASVTMLAWMFANLEEAEILQYLGGAQAPDTSGIPTWMVDQLAFPYNEGLMWGAALAGADPFDPDFTEIDGAYTDPPESTEQIIHMNKWDPREDPTAVTVPDLPAALGDGWEEVDATPIGQAAIGDILAYLGVRPTEADAAAAGWGGDRSVVVSGPDDAFALAWRLAWDTPADAAEFVAAYEVALASLDFPASVTALPDGQVLVAHASSEELLAQTVDAAGD